MKRISLCLATLALLSGCTKPTDTATPTTPTPQTTSTSPPPVFSLTWSEYPSWSVFGVAHELGLLDEAAGKQGTIEKKWNVDIVLKGVDYDTCIQLYGTGEADAVCITNMDILGPSSKKRSTLLFPTSTSAGADACLAVDIADLASLKGTTSYGLERSVSQYFFERVLEKNGLVSADFPFANMDPSAAAQQLQQGADNVKSIVVWNPYVMETLQKQSKAKVLADSTAIPEEIIDMVIASTDVMAKPGAKDFAYALMEAFYTVSDRIDAPATADETLVALGEKFSNLDAEKMKVVVIQTKFYKTPQAAIDLLSNQKFKTETMPAVAKFCVDHGIVELASGTEVSMGFDAADKQLNFSSEYLKAYATQSAKK
jgi:ABC-type nitrate/sulfonate/bicarbonate transport system substrate-binding protein